MSEINRRSLLRGGLFAAGGAGAAWAAVRVPHLWEPHRLPISGGYAPTEDHGNMITHGQVNTTFFVPTDEMVIALTFDDGPEPDWTPLVLDQLDAVDAPATFFMVGEHLRRNRHLVADRMARHEIGNHTWTHPDLAQQDVAGVLAQLGRTHDQIGEVFEREPTLMRPPYGHIGGSTLLAAANMGYDVVLWSQEMHPETFHDDTAAQVDDIVRHARPGGIVLIHDVGDPARLGGLRGIADIVHGLRGRGFRLVTVSELAGMAVRPKPT